MVLNPLHHKHVLLKEMPRPERDYHQSRVKEQRGVVIGGQVNMQDYHTHTHTKSHKFIYTPSKQKLTLAYNSLDPESDMAQQSSPSHINVIPLCFVLNMRLRAASYIHLNLIKTCDPKESATQRHKTQS